ncbi:uncharacterized protein MONBRDRAFT_24808 [Monosiga brevicollis MX1]|uniref:Band 7 domain-containing protein n=1 Tax=Monosiga brevicollis TaxID=81824 RepID=A9UXS9_MONBE|nr:uncharacterized protein MONBRDRAFT_24808 [Monosiga brevicollis MX1]EDQ89740.1 predicted protein [Monosiga brevicollis MX1]|eukprot:XP_001745162.1 hypothetical protein [Monosiga brevicollis MX1]
MFWTVKRTLVGLAAAILSLSLIIVLATSFARVADDEICQLFYPDGGKLVTQSEPALVFIGPSYEKYCVPRHTLHLRFESDSDEGLDRVIQSRTKEGLPVSLAVDVEYKFTPEGLETSMQRVGFADYSRRLYMAARAEVRNVASLFEVQSFLRGTREAIAATMRDNIAQTIVERDGVLIDVIRVNLLTVKVHESFENKFQEVEDILLAHQALFLNPLGSIRAEQIEAEADHRLAVIEESRLNETDVINLLAQRGRQNQSAHAEVIEATLEQQSSMTTARTKAIRERIQAESARAQQLIRKQTALEETIADRDIQVAKAERQVVATLQLAETERLNMVTEMEGQVRRAMANRTRDISQGLLNQTRRLEGLAALRIDHDLSVFEIRLNSNVSAQQTRDRGTADAEDEFVRMRTSADAHLALQAALNMSDAQLASLLWHRGISASTTNKTVFLDYDKVALLNEFGPHNTQTVASVTP